MADDKKVKKCVKALERLINYDGLPPKQAHQQLRDEYEELEVGPANFDALEVAYQKIQESIHNIERLTLVNSVRAKIEPWYAGPSEDHKSWQDYKQHLINKGWEDTVQSIDDSSTAVVSMLNSPGLSKFSGRGLVLGYVQSGKTANMAAVIAKASDAGYRLIIVLTGMIEKLRQQTQQRFTTDLLDHDKDGKWEPWTTLEEDFSQKTYPGFVFNPGQRNIMIIKKQKDVLDRILEKLDNTSKAELLKHPVLVIDDECDQASVNSPGKDNDWKTINRQIRQVIGKFPRASYIGYTATPFANILIDPSIDPTREEDLYPKDFIYSLPRPDNYFGAERLFGRDLLDADNEPAYDEELDIIRTVPNDELVNLQGKGKNPNFQITASLEDAIDYFLIATAIRDQRGDRSKHSSMLIHTSQKIDIQSDIYTETLAKLRQVKSLLEKKDSKYIKRLENLWEKESEKVPPELFDYKSIPFQNLINDIVETAADTEIVVENSKSPTARIDYDSAPADKGRRYICIGGNVLARGLTIEGLVSSFFVRTASQYDTLMQMGRWFGYRQGYEDLSRVWMTAAMSDNFFALATVEADMRYQIENYKKTELTPLDIAVRIRKIPGLAITARNKMLAAKVCDYSYAGQHQQTTRFYQNNESILQKNRTAASTLVEKGLNGKAPEQRDQGLLIRKVHRGAIEEFLHNYTIHETHASLIDTSGKQTTNHLLEYINSAKAENPESLKEWNVGIIQPKHSKAQQAQNLSLGPIESLSTINRSRFKTLQNGDADIKALMSRSDIEIDLSSDHTAQDDWNSLKAERLKHHKSNVPLLLLYLIDRDSRPLQTKKDKPGVKVQRSRSALEAKDHIVGIGIVFPGAKSEGGPSYHVEVKLPDLDDAEEAMLEDEVNEI